MANAQVSLMTYLQHSPQAIPVIYNGQSTKNTTNQAYNWENIGTTQHWADFSIQGVQQRFGQLLQAALIPDDAFPGSPPQPIVSEDLVRYRIAEYISPRVRRALRSGFHFLSQTGGMGDDQSIIGIDAGGAASHIGNFAPDLAFFNMTEEATQRPNRAPGDIKPSFKWSSGLANSPRQSHFQEYMQALSQVNYYMIQHQARYGYLLTNQELVAIRRIDADGNLELATPIPWTATGTADAPQMTVLLGLWYLGMLASDNTNWQL